jgi:hypothetical protein
MSWASIANDQLVTRDNLQNGVDTGVLLLKSAITGTGTRIVTKSNVNSFIFMNESQATWASLASNRCPTKLQILNAKQDREVYEIRVTNNPTYSTTTLNCTSNIDPGSSGNYDYVQGRVTATILDQTGAAFNNNLGYTIEVYLDATASGCYNGPTNFTISITNGNSSNFVQYDYQKVDNCGDPDAFACTFNQIDIDCVTSITNGIPMTLDSNVAYCGSTTQPL